MVTTSRPALQRKKSFQHLLNVSVLFGKTESINFSDRRNRIMDAAGPTNVNANSYSLPGLHVTSPCCNTLLVNYYTRQLPRNLAALHLYICCQNQERIPSVESRSNPPT
ncbi:hypothetical protein GDO78_008882 [Eleutherodactylus coqui]|uniref:Uncharacterized protein n=1 Tax=Eleutherodactylus coqui TaxID=57060 RepID=A0A8J6FE96_ELECQ|nr:hypothetical protein GDO78_008882 [Eleutherodactylus coqui]